ncbi:uncharacterized protein LOC112053118 [Bicyclus anynana]|uniref:Uncharacterized protein LOC112053118 n=1 Tax=Bicyclus anynana TaxID=110368 RepID=A0A6J1NXL2_BICAN|nr:uncharacterized protein LOC112053118 [Bicyclus anynana]
MLYEISRKSINFNTYEETNITWTNSVLTVRGNKDLFLLEYSYNLHSLHKGIDFKESTVTCNTNPVSSDYLNKYVSRGLKNMELVEMISNSAFWPHSKALMRELTIFTSYHWSPFYLLSENDTLLATVNSVGNVDFFAPRKHAWYSVLDFSTQVAPHLTENLKKLSENPKTFEDVKETVYSIETSSVCWASELNEDNSCYFVTAQRSGDILFWSIKYHHNNFEIDLCDTIKSSTDVEIIHMFWIDFEQKCLLVCSKENGEVILYECDVTKKKITVLNTHNVWSYKDKMITNYLHFQIINGKLLLFFNKLRHFVIQMYDKNLKLLSQNVQNVNDYKITSITKFKDLLYLTTVNMKIYKINYSIENDSLHVSLEGVEIKEPAPSYELYGLAVSPNGSLFALSMINRKHLLKKQKTMVEIVLLSFDSGCDADMIKIINNPTKKLTHIWDVIETVRCKTIKSKKLPERDYSLLLKDDSDMYSLKVYLIVLKLHINLKNSMAWSSSSLLSEKSVDVIKEKILMLQAFAQIHKLYANFKSNNSLYDFDHKCFAGSKNYLYYYCKKYGKNLNSLVTEDVLNITDLQFKYLCQWCEESLIDFSCKNKHTNMICTHSFTPIENDYLFCKCCNATAKSELYDQNPTCIFCDLHLVNEDLLTIP